MSKLFICDSCGDTFPQPLDEEKYKDEHGVWYVFDLCAPCRKLLKDKKDKTEKDFLGKLAKKK